MYGGDEVSAIVVDMGTTCTKSGYAGEDCPKYVIPSSVGVLGGEAGEAAERRAGTNALSVRADGMQVVPALSEGVVADWDAAEAILDHTYKSCLSCNPADHPLLMAEANHNTKEAREKMAELAFEKFGVPALFLSKSAVLTAFASGRGTALVLDVGGGVASAAAVHDGYLLKKSVRRHSLAGDAINEIVLKSTQLRATPPPLLPLYTLKRTEVRAPPEEIKNKVAARSHHCLPLRARARFFWLGRRWARASTRRSTSTLRGPTPPSTSTTSYSSFATSRSRPAAVT